MKRTQHWTSGALALLILVLAVAPAQAQFDPGEYNIIQAGVLVGHMYVPERPRGACEYQEYWLVFDDYRYPGSVMGLETTIEVSEEPTGEILRRMREGEGRWITVEAFERRPECAR